MQEYAVTIGFTTSAALMPEVMTKLRERADQFRTVGGRGGLGYRYSIVIGSLSPYVAVVTAGRLIETSLAKAGVSEFTITEVAAAPFGAAALTLVPKG